MDGHDHSAALFITKNADVEPASAAVHDRIDTDSTIDPSRFISGIDTDRNNPNRAFVTYSGYSASHADDAGSRVRGRLQPDHGHGDVDADRRRGHAGGPAGHPRHGRCLRHRTGDLYVSNDFGVSLLAKGSSTWTEAATGLPNVMVPSLTLVAEERVLYAATHGFAAWQLNIGTRDRR